MTAHSPSEVFRRQVRITRRYQELSQRELADRLAQGSGLPMTPAKVMRVESGNRRVTLDEVVSFARALDVPISALVLPPDSGDAQDAAACERAGRAVKDGIDRVYSDAEIDAAIDRIASSETFVTYAHESPESPDRCEPR